MHSRTIGQQAREQIENSLEQTREAASDLLERGRDIAGARLGRRREGLHYGSLALAAVTGAAAYFVTRWAPWSRFTGARTVEDVMVRDVETINGSATLMEAARRMKEANVGVLPVIEGNQVRGVITDRDIVVRAIAQGENLATTRVSDCATQNPVVARPDWTVDQARSVMADRQIGRLPVVDFDNRLVGMVTLSSLALRAARKEQILDTAKEVSMRSARAS